MFGTTRPDSVKARVLNASRNSRWIYDPKTFQNKGVPVEKLKNGSTLDGFVDVISVDSPPRIG